jgi:hypothetical protein
MGVRMTKQIKRVGCANLKTLIEGDKLLTNSFKIIQEMSTFAKRGQSWQAEDGANDDLMMCLVIFGWISNQGYFKELTNHKRSSTNVCRTTKSNRTRYGTIWIYRRRY